VQEIIVIGAGVSGLTSAVCLAEAGYAVQLWTAEMPLQTASAVSSFIWYPDYRAPLARTVPWSQTSLQKFCQLANNPRTGVTMAPTLIINAADLDAMLQPGSELISRSRSLPNSEPFLEPSRGFRSTTPLIEMQIYLMYLLSRLEAAGGEIEIRRVASLVEAAKNAPIVINCAGSGAAALAGDYTVQTYFGQAISMTNPGIEQGFFESNPGTEWTRYFAHPRSVSCGGVSIPGRTDSSPDPEITARIIDRCVKVEERLASATLIEVRAGLRLYRPSVRVEAEWIASSRCIHNYGHGDNGVTLSWGCAVEILKFISNACKSGQGHRMHLPSYCRRRTAHGAVRATPELKDRTPDN
jgi:D-amino-acid oxidase